MAGPCRSGRFIRIEQGGGFRRSSVDLRTGSLVGPGAGVTERPTIALSRVPAVMPQPSRASASGSGRRHTSAFSSSASISGNVSGRLSAMRKLRTPARRCSSGMPVPVGCRRLGHSNVQMTLRYAHLVNRDIEASRASDDGNDDKQASGYEGLTRLGGNRRRQSGSCASLSQVPRQTRRRRNALKYIYSVNGIGGRMSESDESWDRNDYIDGHCSPLRKLRHSGPSGPDIRQPTANVT